jgi:lipopolysaccharide transport system ATP-binding protein
VTKNARRWSRAPIGIRADLGRSEGSSVTPAISAECLSKRYQVGKGSSLNQPQRLLNTLLRRPQPARRAMREVWALDDISFAVEPGTILGIIGPNGAGKTTLLKILGRVTLPTRGRIVGRGRVVSLLALGSGFQPDLSGRENIYLQAALYGVPSAEIARRFDDIAEFAELHEFLEVPVKRYSSGMFIRLAFAAAINMDADILLADEVLAVGDIAFQERCLQRVQEAGESGMTVLFVSHDMAAIRRLCHRVIWLDLGHIVEDGDPEGVVTHYETAALTGRGRKEAAANEHAQILAARLVSSEGDELGAVRVSERVSIEVTVDVLTSDVEMRCAIAVSTRGVLAFRSTLADSYVCDSPGIYRFRAWLPADLLSDVSYTVKVGVAVIHEGQQSFLVRDEALAFTAYAADDGIPLWDGYRERSGIVSPRLTWEVTREHDRVLA